MQVSRADHETGVTLDGRWVQLKQSCRCLVMYHMFIINFIWIKEIKVITLNSALERSHKIIGSKMKMIVLLTLDPVLSLRFLIAMQSSSLSIITQYARERNMFIIHTVLILQCISTQYHWQQQQQQNSCQQPVLFYCMVLPCVWTSFLTFYIYYLRIFHAIVLLQQSKGNPRISCEEFVL